MAVVVEHGGFGASAAAPIAKDVVTYLFDRPRALEALAAMETQWGGNTAERMERRAQRWLEAQQAAAAAAGEGR